MHVLLGLIIISHGLPNPIKGTTRSNAFRIYQTAVPFFLETTQTPSIKLETYMK
jgi:hypothetical protein